MVVFHFRKWWCRWVLQGRPLWDKYLHQVFNNRQKKIKNKGEIDYNPSCWVLKAAVEKISKCSAWSIFRESEGRQWQSDRFFWFAVWMSLVILLSGPEDNRHGDCPYMSCGGGFSEVYIKLSHFSLHGFGKRAVLIPVTPSQEGGWEIRNVSSESCSQPNTAGN